MQFITIQDGAYTINLSTIASIQWNETDADVTLVNGESFTFECEDLEKLVSIVEKFSV